MKTFNFTVAQELTQYGRFDVEAKTIDEAIEMARLIGAGKPCPGDVGVVDVQFDSAYDGDVSGLRLVDVRWGKKSLKELNISLEEIP